MGVITETLKIETTGAQASLREVEQSLERTRTRSFEAEEGFGRAGSSAAKLAGAAGMLSPELGSVALGLADLADVGEVAGSLLGGFEVTAGGLVTGLGTMALALAPLLPLWKDYAAAQEQATAAAEAWARVQDASLPLVDRALAAQKQLNLEVSGLTDAEKEQARIAMSWDAALAKVNETVREELALAQERLAKLGPSKAGYEDARAAVERLEAQLADNNDTAAKGMLADQQLAEIRRATAEANKVLTERERDLTTARSGTTDATQAQLAAERAELDAINRLIDGNLGLDLAATRAELAQQEVSAAFDDITAAVERTGAAAESTAEKMARLGRTGRVDVMGLMGGGTSALGVLGGDLLGGLAMMGPQGAAIAGLVGGLQSIGQQGASGVSEQLNGFFADLTAGIKALPEILGEVLPSAFAEGMPALVDALVQAAPEFAIASVRAQAELVRTPLLELPSMMGEALGEALREWWLDASSFLRDPLGSLMGGSENTLLERAQNTAVDLLRVVAGVATFGGSEIVYGMANGASGGAVQKGLYAGDREEARARSASAAWLSRPSRDLEEQRLSMQLGRVLNDQDRRNNLESSTGVLYRPAGPTRV